MDENEEKINETAESTETPAEPFPEAPVEPVSYTHLTLPTILLV